MRLSLIIVVMLLLSFLPAGRASYYVKQSPARHSSVSAPKVESPHTVALPEKIAADGYKGIIALAAGGGGALCLLIALMASAIGFMIPAFFLGIGGIIFGALPKTTNRGMGRAGLILGILDVVLIILFIVAVAVALSMLV